MIRDADEMAGKVYITNNCGPLEVLEYNHSQKVLVRFLNTGYQVVARKDEILKGNVADPYHPRCFGIGYLGEGEYTCSLKGKLSESYIKWYDMLERCYCPKRALALPTYYDCLVSTEWHNFQNFAKWFYNYAHKESGWHLDKDILFEGNKIYSEETCCIVPVQINILFQTPRTQDLPTGVSFYKQTGKYKAQINKFGRKFSLGYFTNPKEASSVYNKHRSEYLCEIAEVWKSKIDSKVYNAIKEKALNLTE